MGVLNFLIIISLLSFAKSELIRMKRSLIFNGPAKVQAIMGAGFPLDLQQESAIVGVVIKGHYTLPSNSSDLTSPSIHFARRRRRANPVVNRWDVYKVLEQFAESYGLGGKGCLLRTICELADAPIDKSTSSLLHEILHVLFRPSSTSLVESPEDYLDRDYYAAEKLGRSFKGRCARFFKHCKTSFVDLFTISYP